MPGSVVHVYLFFAHVLLDDLLPFDNVLAQPYLLLNHRALLYHDLFLDYGYPDLAVFFDDTAFRGFLCTLCLSPARLDRHPLHSSRLLGTESRSRSILTRLRTLTLPASRSRVPATSSSSLLCTVISSSSVVRLLLCPSAPSPAVPAVASRLGEAGCPCPVSPVAAPACSLAARVSPTRSPGRRPTRSSPVLSG